MDIQEFYALGKKLYDDNKHEKELDSFYLKMDDLLDDLDARRDELKLLLEELEKDQSETVEDKLQEKYTELAEASAEVDSFDMKPIEKIESERETFRAKNKYKFIQVEELEKKYALAVEKKKPEKDLADMLDVLKKQRMDLLGIQKQLERFNAQIEEAKQPLIKLQAKKEKILKDISELQKKIHKKATNESEESEKMKQIIIKKKNDLDILKNEIKKQFITIGKEAYSKGLK